MSRLPQSALAGIARGLAHQHRLLDLVLSVSPTGVLSNKDLDMETALAEAGWTDHGLDGVGRSEVYWAVRHIRLCSDLGLDEAALRLLLHDGPRPAEQWALLLRVGPTMQEVQRWKRDGWPDEQAMETVAALRRP